ncbi:hypothetical protein MRX96_047030 [Rhipicephalus microplus]
MSTNEFLAEHGMSSALLALYLEVREKPGWHAEYPYGAQKYGEKKMPYPPGTYNGLTHRVFLFKVDNEISIGIESNTSDIEYANGPEIKAGQNVTAFIRNSPDFWTVSTSFDPVPKKIPHAKRDTQSNIVYFSTNCTIIRLNHVDLRPLLVLGLLLDLCPKRRSLQAPSLNLDLDLDLDVG